MRQEKGRCLFLPIFNGGRLDSVENIVSSRSMQRPSNCGKSGSDLKCTDKASVSEGRNSMKITNGIGDISKGVRTFVSATNVAVFTQACGSRFFGFLFSNSMRCFPGLLAQILIKVNQALLACPNCSAHRLVKIHD